MSRIIRDGIVEHLPISSRDAYSRRLSLRRTLGDYYLTHAAQLDEIVFRPVGVLDRKETRGRIASSSRRSFRRVKWLARAIDGRAFPYFPRKFPATTSGLST